VLELRRQKDGLKESEMNSKWLEREFLLTLSSYIFGALMLTGVITPDQGQIFGEASDQIVGGVVAVISGGSYAISRGLAKKV
jgi:hypothetical protein